MSNIFKHNSDIYEHKNSQSRCDQSAVSVFGHLLVYLLGDLLHLSLGALFL